MGLGAQRRGQRTAGNSRPARGPHHVEVSAEEATAVLNWPRNLDGWDPGALAPVWIYPAAPAA